MLIISYKNGKEHEKSRLIAEINVTPMVDVMLVLLIIFMVTAPLLETGIPVDLPKVSANSIKGEEKPVTITVNGQGQVFIQETPVTFEELRERLITVSGQNLDMRIFIRGDKEVLYGKMMDIMGIVTAVGFSRVALLTEPLETSSPPLKSRKGSP